jgi:hypothetical protein
MGVGRAPQLVRYLSGGQSIVVANTSAVSK